MKKLLLVFVLFVTVLSYGQITPINIVEIKGITTTIRDAYTPPAGTYPVIYNTTDGEHQKWNGSAWEAIGSGGGSADGNDFLTSVTESGGLLTFFVSNQTNPTLDLNGLDNYTGSELETKLDAYFGSSAWRTQDGTGTDSQTLSFASPDLSISGGNSVDLSALQDGTGTDDQTATEVSYTNATSGLAATDVQAALDEIEGRTDTNDAKVGITTQQADDITTNNSKISYTDAAAVSANTAKVSADGSVGTHSDVSIGSPVGSTSGTLRVLADTNTDGTYSVVDWTPPTGGGGEANTASNLGAGEGLFTTKSGIDLPFKSLVAGTNISLSSDANTVTINSTGGGGTVDVVSNVATNTILGRTTAGSGDSEELTPASVRTLLNIEDGATADQTGVEIKAAYEGEADTNAFTDAEKTKLSGIETGATADQSAAEVTFSNATSGLTATDTQAAIDELEARVDLNDAKVTNTDTTFDQTANYNPTGIWNFTTGDVSIQDFSIDGPLGAGAWGFDQTAAEALELSSSTNAFIYNFPADGVPVTTNDVATKSYVDATAGGTSANLISWDQVTGNETIVATDWDTGRVIKTQNTASDYTITLNDASEVGDGEKLGFWQLGDGKFIIDLPGTDLDIETIDELAPLYVIKDPFGNYQWTGNGQLTTVDLTPPSAPTGLVGSNETSSSFDISWSAATDNVGVASYEYRLDSGSEVNVGNVLTTNVSGLAASTGYLTEVRAVDGAGNVSAWSTGVTVTTTATGGGTYGTNPSTGTGSELVSSSALGFQPGESNDDGLSAGTFNVTNSVVTEATNGYGDYVIQMVANDGNNDQSRYDFTLNQGVTYVVTILYRNTVGSSFDVDYDFGSQIVDLPATDWTVTSFTVTPGNTGTKRFQFEFNGGSGGDTAQLKMSIKEQ